MALVERVSHRSMSEKRLESFMQRMVRTINVYVVLTKPKIQVMLLFTAYCAMVLANHGATDWKLTLATLFGLGLSGAGSAAVNMWYDRDIDAIMNRTSNRPIPKGDVGGPNALIYGIILVVISFVWLYLLVNPMSAYLALGGAIYYGVIYTMWLKRRTPQNIVIGGGAGAFPPLVGWAAVTGNIGVSAIIMFAIIFLWTPPHFWALALYKNEDYQRAGIPMMPVVRGPKHTKLQSVVYAILLTVVAEALTYTAHLGAVYAAISLGASVIFLFFNIVLYFEQDKSMKWAKRTFVASLAYIPLLFLAMVF